ncbi:porin family protein [Blastochloris sulfoviridis]|uniref:Porin family protein n=1 Tax=Blastochloris sulfoviridis TaxID=50712 RepID=A0A5M6HV81_9HYPH|nr:porin family protein [Blastochloris sulfoviridis]
MRRCVFAVAASLLAVAPAFAADLARRAPTPYSGEPVAVTDWTGIYLGGHVGWGWVETGYFGTAADWSLHQDHDGFLGGGQIGLNYQMDHWVVGLEADISAADLSGGTNDPVAPASRFDAEINWLATLTARAGYDFGGVLVYAKGGAAFADQNLTWTDGIDSATAETRRTGWTAGGGVEVALSPTWSARLDYAYMDFGADDTVFTGSVAPFTPAVDQEVQALKLGVNYRFAPVPPVPPANRPY